MPKAPSKKCQLCSKLSAADAIAKHGQPETGCWEGEKCHKRRHYYLNGSTINAKRRQQYAIKTGKVVPEISVSVPTVPAAYLHLYRKSEYAPIHAFSAELWVGEQKVWTAKPMHCSEVEGSDLKECFEDILRQFSEHLGTSLKRFAATVELDPCQCPIRPCPLFIGDRIIEHT